MRRMWGLPADTSSDIVYLIADSNHTIPIYDELCCSVINCVHSALNSECRLVKCVLRHGLCVSPMKLPRSQRSYDTVSLLIAFADSLLNDVIA